VETPFEGQKHGEPYIVHVYFHTGRRGRHHMELHAQSVPITNKVVSSNPAHGEVYSIQLYVIKFVRSMVLSRYSGTPASSTNETDRHGITEIYIHKKSLKIPKGKSESVYRRRTDNTMAKRKSTKGQTTIYKTYI